MTAEGEVVAPSFGKVLQNRPFAWMITAQLQSVVGDQIGRVALSVLIFEGSGSALFTGAAYALTYLPAILGGVALSGLADRYSRRAVLVAADLTRAAAYAVAGISGTPLWLVGVLVAVSAAAGGVFQAAAPAMVSDLFDGAERSAALGLRTIVGQVGTLGGFAIGGVVVSWVGPSPSLLVNAATFGISSVVLACGLHPVRGLVAGEAGPQLSLAARVGAAVATSHMRRLVGLTLLVGLWVVPEAIAAPYVDQHGAGPIALGILLAALPVGSVVGTAVVTRWTAPRRRSRVARMLAVATGVPLAVTLLNPPIALAAVLWFLAGVCTGYQAQVVTEYIDAIPKEHRSQYLGVVSGGLTLVQGLGLLAGGAVAQVLGPHWAVGLAGLIGLATAASLCRTRSNAQS